MDRRSKEERQAWAIARAMERRRIELRPLRAEMAELIDHMGWRRARRSVRAALGRPERKAGLWKLGKRDTTKVLEALRDGPIGQASLFDWKER